MYFHLETVNQQIPTDNMALYRACSALLVQLFTPQSPQESDPDFVLVGDVLLEKKAKKEAFP